MQTYIAMLRGINVSGQKMIRMNDLIALLTELDLKNIRTYIQSGNLVFEHTEIDQKVLASVIEQKIWQHYKFEVPVIIRDRTELLKIVEKNPFLKRNEDINRLHVTFLAEEPLTTSIEKVEETEYYHDEFEVIGKEIFLFCPYGYGNTKLNNTFFEKKFNTRATTRNWKTVLRLVVI